MNLEKNSRQKSKLADKLHYEKLSSLARLGTSSIPVSFFNAILVFYIMRDTVPEQVLWSWLIFFSVLVILRAFLLARFWRLEEGSGDILAWTIVYLGCVYASAACWGILPLWEAVFTTSWSEAFVIFMVAGMSAGGMVSLYPLLKATLPYLLICLGPLIFVLARGEEPAHLAMSIFAIFYLMMLVRSTFVLNASVMKSIRLELENKELFKFLLAAKSSHDSSLSKKLQKIKPKLMTDQ